MPGRHRGAAWWEGRWRSSESSGPGLFLLVARGERDSIVTRTGSAAVSDPRTGLQLPTQV